MKNAVLTLLLLSGLFSLANAVRPDEYIWLHADGQYIRKSPYCDDPNGIWVGCGVAARGISNPTAFAIWAKARGVNCVRISFDGGTASTVIDPIVQACKAQQIYTYIDYHEYMANHDGSPDWMPQGTRWDVDAPSAECTQWLTEWAWIANAYKDEPWVMAYELCNEPRGSVGTGNSGATPALTPELTRKNYYKCLSIIRAVDQRHIVILGNTNFSLPNAFAKTWDTDFQTSQKYKPDFPYNQAAFSFHGYVFGDDIYVPSVAGAELTSTIVGGVQSAYDVPVFCTETGQDTVTGSPTTAQKRRYQQEILEVCSGQSNFWQASPLADKAYPALGSPSSNGKMSWSIWSARGSSTSTFESSADGAQFMDIWPWAAARMASSAPATAIILPTFTPYHLDCDALQKSLFANGIDKSDIAIRVMNKYNERVYGSTTNVTLNISGPGTWEDGTTTDKNIIIYSSAIAATKIKTVLSSSGTISVTASAGGSVISGSTSITTYMYPVKVALATNNVYLRADGTSEALITGYIKDSANNTVTTATGTFHFSVNSGLGSFWLAAGVPGTQRDIVEPGITYIMFRAGNTVGVSTVSAWIQGLSTGTVVINLVSLTADITPPSDVAWVKDGLSIFDFAYTDSLTTLSASWPASTDAESDISKYWYAIGTSSGSTDFLGWTDNSTSRTMTNESLSLTIGATYYISARAQNGDGLLSNPVSSNGQYVVDLTSPAAPADVRDGLLSTDENFTESTTTLSANWDVAADPESGISAYWYAIGTSPGDTDVAPWANNGLITSVTVSGFSFFVGQKNYFSVKAQNGVSSYGDVTNSDGITIITGNDLTPPGDLAYVYDGMGLDLDSTDSKDTLSANWPESADPDSGISKYWYAIGTTSAATNVVSWTDIGVTTFVTRAGLTLTTAQKYFISIKAQNDSGLQSNIRSSNGQRVVESGMYQDFLEVKCYPNPVQMEYLPSSGKVISCQMMKFNGLPAKSILTIYSLSGKLVKVLKEEDFGAGEVRWDCKNENKEYVAHGVYIFAARTKDGKIKTGKFFISRKEKNDQQQ